MTPGGRNPRIDLLRGVSILLVLLHHFDIAYRLEHTRLAAALGWPVLHAVVRNGNYAVTMFFAVSGALITANAARRWGGLGRIRALDFYRDRAARILPCLVLLLLLVDLLAAAGLGIFRDHPEFGGPVPLWLVDLASLTFWMNVLMERAGWLNYVLCVQWSLSIEEVFYAGFPVLCLLLRRDRLLLLACAVFIVIGPIWRVTHRISEYEELNATLSCFDGIAFGCCAALLARHLRPPPRLLRPLQGLAALAIGWFYLSGPIGRTAIYGVTLMALGTAVILFAELAGPAQRRPPPAVLAPLRWSGRLSYELYLFHLVVLGLLRTAWPPDATAGDARLALLAAYLALSAALAVLVSRCYSEPLHRRFRTRPSGLSLRPS